MTDMQVNTPRYVLLEDKRRIGPNLVTPPGSRKDVAIYGFSGKHHYDKFCAKSGIPLTPYPLVRRYLYEQIKESGAANCVVVIDAPGPNESQLNAVSMSGVLEAQEQNAAQVRVSFNLKLDQESESYRIEEALSDAEKIECPMETLEP